MLDAAIAWKLGSLAFTWLAGASKALDHESVATFLEIGATSVEAGEALHDRQRDVVRSGGRPAFRHKSSGTAASGCAPNSAPTRRAGRTQRQRSPRSTTFFRNACLTG